MATTPYLLDTNILLALIRNNVLGQYIDATYRLRGRLDKPLISAVTKGETRALARQFGWGAARTRTLTDLLTNEVLSVEIDRPDIIDAYVEVDWHSYSYPGGSVNMGKN